ncbi:hypothetical protein BH20ACI3_BH20ACI3_03360 [soil metagenome]
MKIRWRDLDVQATDYQIPEQRSRFECRSTVFAARFAFGRKARGVDFQEVVKGFSPTTLEDEQTERLQGW